jgi:hypothetical protein
MVSLTRDVDTDFTRGKTKFTSKTFNSIYYRAFPPSFYHLLRFAADSHKKKASACKIDRETDRERETHRPTERSLRISGLCCCGFRDCSLGESGEAV